MVLAITAGWGTHWEDIYYSAPGAAFTEHRSSFGYSPTHAS
jgi:hypothetical protein